jgi:hypothetical protein
MRFVHGTSRMRSWSGNYSNTTVDEGGVKNNNFVARSGQYVWINTIKPATSLVTSSEQLSETNGDVTRGDSVPSLGADVTVWYQVESGSWKNAERLLKTVCTQFAKRRMCRETAYVKYKVALLHAGFLHGLCFDHEDVSSIFFQNVDCLSTDYIELCKIWGSHSGDYEEYHLLGYNVVQSVES